MTTSDDQVLVLDGMNLKVSSACVSDPASGWAPSSQTQSRPVKSLLRLLDEIVMHRLFGDVPWPASREDCLALESFFIQHGLQELVPGNPESWRLTELGKQYSADLLSVFMGTYETWEMPLILIEHGLMDDEEAASLWEPPMNDVEFERVLKAKVREAHFKFCNDRFVSTNNDSILLRQVSAYSKAQTHNRE